MTTKEKLLETIEHLPEDKVSELLRIANGFKKESSKSKKVNKWAQFAGILSEEEADAMLAVIEETCERIDYD